MTHASASNIEWRTLGELDLGVSHDLAHGIAEWRDLKKILRQYGATRFGTCVEVGCGAGRLTSALAQDFQEIDALDVSPQRIAQVSGVPGAARIHPFLIDKPVIPVADNSADLCISTHVLQHVSDIKVVRAYFREMFRVLRPGGYIVVHVPVIGAHGFSGTLPKVTVRRLKEIARHFALLFLRPLMAIGVRSFPYISEYHIFEYGEIHEYLKRVGFWPIEMRFLSREGIHSYIFARKLEFPATHLSSILYSTTGDVRC